MRKLLLVLCALLLVTASMEAKKKVKTPAWQKTPAARQQRTRLKQLQKNRKAPKHRQKVN